MSSPEDLWVIYVTGEYKYQIRLKKEAGPSISMIPASNETI